MIDALLLIFARDTTWERIVRTQRGALYVLCVVLLPLLAVTSAAEGYGLAKWGRIGRIVGERAYHIQFTPREVVVFEAVQAGCSLVIILGGAKALKALCETFGGRHFFTPAFAALAYGLSPLFFLRILDIVPSLSVWIGWAIGIMLSLSALYQGVPRMMRPDPSHAFGLFFMCALVMLVATGALRFLTGLYLQGKLPQLQTLFAG
jgi:hypothetical protein